MTKIKTTIQVMDITPDTGPVRLPNTAHVANVLPPAKVDMCKWPSCRIVVQSLELENPVYCDYQFLFHQNGEIPEGYMYAGTVLNANPRYLAHLLYKIVVNN